MHVYNHPQVDIIAEDHTVQCLHLFFFACLYGVSAKPPIRRSCWSDLDPHFFWDFCWNICVFCHVTGEEMEMLAIPSIRWHHPSTEPTLASGRIAVLKWLAGCSFCAWTWVARGHLASETAAVRPFLGWKCGSKPKIGMAQHQGTFRKPRNQWVVKVTSPYQSCGYLSEPDSHQGRHVHSIHVWAHGSESQQPKGNSWPPGKLKR